MKPSEFPAEVTWRPGRNGGRLRSGGTNKGGPGRPTSAIRERLRDSLEARLTMAEGIADDPKSTPSDKLRALDLMLKYGLGTTTTSTDTEGRDAPTAGRLTPNEINAEVKRVLGGDYSAQCGRKVEGSSAHGAPHPFARGKQREEHVKQGKTR